MARRGQRRQGPAAWCGRARSRSGITGLHKFRLYVSGYFKLYIDGKAGDGWLAAELEALVPALRAVRCWRAYPQTIRIEWTPQGGYLRLLHLDPLPDDERHEFRFSSEVAKTIDYYFVVGTDMDDVIAGYRALTGKAVMLPRWAYGFWQSRQRYETQDQLLGVLDEYRKEKLPLDAIVQDWLYWPEDAVGQPRIRSHALPRSRQPW